MVIRNPCKRCIVRACCRFLCDKKHHYYYTKEKIAKATYILLFTLPTAYLLFELFL